MEHETCTSTYPTQLQCCCCLLWLAFSTSILGYLIARWTHHPRMSTTRQRPSVPVPSGKSNSPTKLGSGAGGGSTENPKLERKTKRKHKPPVEDTWSQTIFNMLPIIILLPVLYYVLQRQSSNQAYGYGSRQAGVEELDRINGDGRKVGHWDFGDGRSNSVGKVWVEGCENCHWVNTNLGNGG